MLQSNFLRDRLPLNKQTLVIQLEEVKNLISSFRRSSSALKTLPSNQAIPGLLHQAPEEQMQKAHWIFLWELFSRAYVHNIVYLC